MIADLRPFARPMLFAIMLATFGACSATEVNPGQGATASPIAADSAVAATDSCALYPVLIEDFNELSVDAHKIGPARWTAHTPWNGDYGDAGFADPGPDGPFSIKDGILTITASKDAAGRWRSGLLAAADRTGAGSGTRYGYFETRMKFPPGSGVWPQFWLTALKPIEATDPNGVVEIDVIEYVGKFPTAFRSTVHAWYRDARTRSDDKKIDVPSGALVSDFHTYGVDLSPQAIVYFLDGRKIWSHETPPELTWPMYPLIDLALGGGWPSDQTPNPSALLVDYVHVFGRGPGPRSGCSPGLPR